MRRKFLIPLALAVGVLTLGHLTGIKNYQRVSAEEVPSYQTYVPLRDGWIEPTDGCTWNDLNGSIRARNDRFWNGNSDPNHFDSQERSFNALDEFIDTIHKPEGGEGWRGAYRTPELTLVDNDHRYISFLFGGGSGDIFINIFQVTGAAGSGDRITGIRTAFDRSGTFDDKDAKLNAPISCNMVFKYYELPNEIQPGDKFLIYVRDGKTSDYGGFTFGDVHINQTLEDVARSFSAHKTQMKLNEYMSDWTRNANEYVLNFYANDSYYATVRTAEAALTDANDGFEINNRLSKWAYDQENSTYENGDLASINFNSIYSDKEIKWGGYFYDNDGRMPLNKTGNMFLSGEPNDVDGPNCGLPESAKYRLVSPEFTLSGTGLISAKLGGHFTALQLLNSNLEVIATTGDVNPSFVPGDMTNIAASGARLCTMVRTYLDCGEFIGQKVHVALEDTRTGGDWNLAYFDEVITNYPTLPSFQVEPFQQVIGKTENYSHGYILDQYVDKGHNPVFKEAYDFLSVYYANFRSPTNEFDIEKADDDAKLAVANAYLPLSSDAKTLIGQSTDVRYTEEFNIDTWFNYAVNVENKVPESDIATLVSGLVTEHGTSTVAFNANGGTGSMASLTVVNTTKFSSLTSQFEAPVGKKFLRWNTASDDSGLSTTVTSNVTLYAIWVDTAVTTLEGTSSIAALRFDYAEGASSASDIFEASIRFGAFISASVWEDLKTEGTIEGYGIIVAETANLTGTIKSNYEAAEGDGVDAKLAALCADSHIKKASRTGDTPALADAQQKSYMGVDEEYYIWQVRQDIDGNFATKYTSVAYIKFSGGIVFLNEVTTSGKEMADAALDRTNPSDPVRPALTIMQESL